MQIGLWPTLEGLVTKLERLLPKTTPSSPIMLAGDWGSGKTSILRALDWRFSKSYRDPARERPSGAQGKGGTPTVWFNAWKHEREGDLLAALLRAVWDRVPYPDKRSLEIDSIKRRIEHGLGGIATEATWKALDSVGGSFLRPAVEAALDLETAEPSIGPAEEIRQAFQQLVSKVWGQRKTLLVLVDDLDRCSPESAVAMVDSIRLLIGDAYELSCRFLVALDRTVMSEAIASKFADVSHYEGNRYLEKIFPITIQVPAPTVIEVHDAIGNFLPDLGVEDPDGEHQAALVSAFDRQAFLNPRLVKRCLNRYSLLTNLDSRSPKNSLGDMAKWLAATERWPLLRRLVQEYGIERFLKLYIDSESRDERFNTLRSSYGSDAWIGDSFKAGELQRWRRTESRLQEAGL